MHNRGQRLRTKTFDTHTPTRRAHIRSIPKYLLQQKLGGSVKRKLDAVSNFGVRKARKFSHSKEKHKSIFGKIGDSIRHEISKDKKLLSAGAKDFGHTVSTGLDKGATAIEHGLASASTLLKEGGRWWGKHVPVVGPIIEGIDDAAGFLIGGLGKQIEGYHQQFREDDDFLSYLATVGQIAGDAAMTASGLNFVAAGVAQTEFDVAMQGLHNQIVGTGTFVDTEEDFHENIYNLAKKGVTSLVDNITGNTGEIADVEQNPSTDADNPPEDKSVPNDTQNVGESATI